VNYIIQFSQFFLVLGGDWFMITRIYCRRLIRLYITLTVQ